ncbi:related to Cytochrome P450 55A1 [Phialocephala subalpina]|uniref:Related to Cytochrome P450 55A1 n=1 Tax=Phialocephala subalpina TaxID=576137 RepID=A0A1L7WKC9_9HELO|nr:related to Cytochrome P450 55A1 [Phialocephala subalpina]
MNPPDDMHQRSMVESLFTKEHIDSMRPQIQKTVGSLLDVIIKEGGSQPVDLGEKFTIPIPSYTTYNILGVPFSDLERLTAFAAIRGNGSATASEASNANAALLSYIAHLNKDDVIQIAFLLLVAGNATTSSTILLRVITLLQHLDQLEFLKTDPKKWTAPFVELCRFHTVSTLTTKRVAKEDVVIGGKLIKAGEGIIAVTQSGNRDEEVFPNPDTFDMRRLSGKGRRWDLVGESIDVPHSGWLGWSWRLSTSWQRQPNLKLVIPFEEAKYSPPKKDFGLSELPVVF